MVKAMAKSKVSIVSHKASAEARQRAHKLISDIRSHKAIAGKYKFFCVPIGSQKRRCIVQDKNGKYDLDFQLVLTKKSKAGDLDPTQIKKDFWRAFTDYANQNEKVEDSTTVVTVRASKNAGRFDTKFEKFSFDFVIISIDGEKRIKRNGLSQYTWVQLPIKNSHIYEAFRELSKPEQREVLENHLLPLIIVEKEKDESLRLPTIELFYQETQNYIRRKGK